MKMYSKILALIMLMCFIGATYAAVGYDLDGDGIVDAVSTGRWKADWNGDGIIDWRDPWVTSAGARPTAWHDDWSVRPDWRGARDWNGDGVVDWRDDWHVGGERPWNGDWVKADWNRDGVIDFQDGWRRADDFVVDSWDPTWRGEGWRGETVSVREVPSGAYNDSEWRTVEGPWDSHGWGGNTRLGDWNGDGIVDWKDSVEFNRGIRSGSALPRATIAAPILAAPIRGATRLGDWNGDGIVDWKDSVEFNRGIRSGSALPRATVAAPIRGATRLGDWNGDGIVDWKDSFEFSNGIRSGSALPRGGAQRVSGAKTTTTTGAKQGTTTQGTTGAKPTGTTGTTGTTTKAATTTTAKPAGKR